MIHYCFNTKRELFDAVFARRAAVVNSERMRALDEYEARAGNRVTVEGAIAAFLHPVLEKLDRGDAGWRHYLALVAQVGHIHEWGGAVMTQSFDPVVKRLIRLIGKALPQAREEDLYWGYHFLSGALMLTLSETDRIDRLSNGKCRSTDVAAIEPRQRRPGEAARTGARGRRRRRQSRLGRHSWDVSFRARRPPLEHPGAPTLCANAKRRSDCAVKQNLRETRIDHA